MVGKGGWKQKTGIDCLFVNSQNVYASSKKKSILPLFSAFSRFEPFLLPPSSRVLCFASARSSAAYLESSIQHLASSNQYPASAPFPPFYKKRPGSITSRPLLPPAFPIAYCLLLPAPWRDVAPRRRRPWLAVAGWRPPTAVDCYGGWKGG